MARASCSTAPAAPVPAHGEGDVNLVSPQVGGRFAEQTGVALTG